MHRRTIAGIMTLIYLIIVLTPLAPLAMHSKVVAHAVTGECSGNCDICGCSRESRANHTCCCAKKRQQKLTGDAKLCAGERCIPQVVAPPAAANSHYCDASQSAKPVVAVNDFCAKDKQHQHGESLQDPQHKEKRSKNETIYKCGCPCGKGKLLALVGAGTSELLPFNYTERIVLPHEDTHYSYLPLCMTSRHAEPPDPPPKSPVSA